MCVQRRMSHIGLSASLGLPKILSDSLIMSDVNLGNSVNYVINITGLKSAYDLNTVNQAEPMEKLQILKLFDYFCH